MIDLSPFLTPYPKPNLAPVGSGAEAISELADFREKQSQFKQKQAVDEGQLQNQQAQTAINKSHVEGQNRYYDQQAQTRAEQVSAAASEKLRNRQMNLAAEFRKAKTPEQRQLILQALKGLKLNYTEEASAVPDLSVKDTDLAHISPVAEIPGTIGSTLKNGQDEPHAPGYGEGEPGLVKSFMEKQGAPEPVPWDVVGMGTPKPAEPAKPAGKGRHIITDPSTGERILDWDQPAERAAGDAQMRAVLAPYVTDPSNPQQADAANRAAEAGTAAYDATNNKEFGINVAKEMMAKEMGQFKKETRAGAVGTGGGGGGGPSKTDIKLQGMDNAEADKIIDRVARDYSFKAAVGSSDDAKQGLALMQQLDSGFGDAAAFGSFLNGISGKVVSDKERAFYMGSEGFWTEMSAKVAKYTNGGRLPPELMNELRQRFLTTIETANDRRREAGRIARESALHTPGTEGSADRVEGHFTGTFKDAPAANRLNKSSGKGAAKPVQKSPEAAPAEDEYQTWLKAHPRP